MYCPKCGTPNADMARFCEKCGMALTSAPPAQPPASAPIGSVGSADIPDRMPVGGVGAAAMPQPAPTPQQNWQAPPQQNWQAPPANQQGWQAPPQYQQAWQAAPQAGGKRYAVGKDATLAMILSIFLSPVGQFYNGDIKKGLAFLGGYVLSGILTLVGIGYLGIFAIWIWSIVDAYNVAKQKAPLW